MEYEKELRESGEYTEIEIQEKTMFINCLKDKLIKHHELYRFPVKAEFWEDIWDQCINPNGSKWIGGGHQSGADTEDENLNISYQNKSGQIKKSSSQTALVDMVDISDNNTAPGAPI